MDPKPSYRLPKAAKLKSRKDIQLLFNEGKRINTYPIRCNWRKNAGGEETRVAFSVSSRQFKKSVDRNRIKRLLRECWRLNKPGFFPADKPQPAIDVFLLYTGSTLPVFSELMPSMLVLFKKLSAALNESD